MNRFYNQHDKQYLSIAMPAAIESLFTILLSAVDLIMVGSLGAVAIAAVSIFLQPRLALLCVARSMSATMSLLTANKVGACETADIPNLLKQGLCVGAIANGFIHILFFVFLQDILTLMGAEVNYLQEALIYGRIATVAAFVTSITLIVQAVQLGYGETDVIMRTNVVGNVVNIVCNALLIYGVGPFPKLGVMGAAIGTVIGTLTTLGLTIYVMLQEKGKFFTPTSSCVPSAKFWKEFMPVFTSVFSEQGFERIGMVLFAKMAAGLGTVPFAVHSICMNVCDVYYCFAMGLGKASMVLAGQATGAKNKDAWRLFNRTGIKWGVVFSTLAFAITWGFHEQIFGLYSDDPNALAMSGVVMFLVALVSYPEAHALICANILRGSGQTKVVAMYSLVLITILRPLMTAFFLYYLEWGLLGAWLALFIDQCLRAACWTFFMYRLGMKKISLAMAK